MTEIEEVRRLSNREATHGAMETAEVGFATEPVTLKVELAADELERIARAAAEIAASSGPEPWIGVDDAARYLGYTDDTLRQGRKRVYDLHQRRCVRFEKDGARLLTKRSWIDRYIEQTEPRRAA